MQFTLATAVFVALATLVAARPQIVLPSGACGGTAGFCSDLLGIECCDTTLICVPNGLLGDFGVRAVSNSSPLFGLRRV